MSQPGDLTKVFRNILVWDVPTRVFHWLFALSFGGAFLTAESERFNNIHVMLGYTFLGLIAFRLLWGVFGTRHARFRSFLFKPGELVTYLSSLVKGNPAHYAGHNPAGSVAIWLLLTLGIVSGLAGVLLFQDVGGHALEELHEILSFAMLSVVGVHLVGVLVSSVMHRENLVRAMITGHKQAKPEESIHRSYAWLGVIMLATVVAFWVNYSVTDPGASGNSVSQPRQHDDD
jgi:cytochrome b